MSLSPEELERIYLARYGPFRHGAAAILGDYERAHDAVQDAFARALAQRARFRGGSPEAWIWRIVERRALDLRRTAGAIELDERFEPELPGESCDAELAAAVRRLPPRRRLVV